jgi:hypothetical protein
MIYKLVVIAVGFMVMGSSCKEEIDDSDGPIAASSTVLNAICYRLDAEQLLKLKVGEQSVAAKSIAYFSGASALVEAHRLQVLSKDRETCNTSGGSVPCDRYEMFEELEDVASNQRFHFEREMLLPVVENKAAALALKVERDVVTSDDPSTQDSTIDQEICYLTEDLYRGVGIKMTFHNFVSKKVEREPPPAVKAQANCAGLNPCKIIATEYQFDQQFVAEDGSRFRRHFVYEIANNVPYTSRYMVRCITHSIPQHFDDNNNGTVDDGEIRIVPVHECREVRNFSFGS